MPIVKLLTALLLSIITISVRAASPEDAASIQRQISVSVENRDYLTAISTLKMIEESRPELFELNNYDYLLARMAEKSSDYALAMKSYTRVANRGSVLKEYALKHLAQIARFSGNLVLERMYLQEIEAFGEESRLAGQARDRISVNAFELGNFDESILMLTAEATSKFNSRSTADRGRRDRMLLLARAYQRGGNATQAVELYKQLNANSDPSQPDDVALEAVKALDLLESAVPGEIPALSDHEHVRRGLTYHFNRDFDRARDHYKAIVNHHSNMATLPEAVFQIGRGYSLQGDSVEAISWFERIVEQYPDHLIAGDALLHAASSYARVGKFRESVARYRKFIEKYPDDKRLDRAYLNIIDVLRDQGEETEALRWADTTREAFEGKLPEAIALYARARIFLARHDWPSAEKDLQALETFSELGGVSVPGGTNLSEVRFLRGYALEHMRMYAEAIRQYVSIPDGRREYYGQIARNRLILLSNDPLVKPLIDDEIERLNGRLTGADPESRRRDLQAIIRLTSSTDLRNAMLIELRRVYENVKEYKNIPNFRLSDFGRKVVITKESPILKERHRAIADEMIFLGLFDEGTPELELSLSDSGAPRSALSSNDAYTLAVFYKRGDLAERGVDFIEPLWKNIPADYQIQLIPTDQLELMYPAPYIDSLLKYATPRNVDSRFLLSIMRQESRFNENAKSNAAARGLMQFISTTSEKMAGETERGDFVQNDLYYPPTSILFASQYVSNLFKLFPAQPEAVTASYNAGEDNMKRWLNRSKASVPGRYVPEIQYAQTKDYVYKVMANYRMYTMLYSESVRGNDHVKIGG
ncbi:MAG: transglycosylase SLT domain-containing protein [Pyrinomonadaceae bacterium]